MHAAVKGLLRGARNTAWNVVHRASGSPRRLFSRREEFLEVLPKRSVGAELGVFKGEFSQHIIAVVKPRELHLVDVWWTAYGDRYPDWGPYTDHGRLRTADAYHSALSVVERRGTGTEVVVHVGDDLDYLERLPDHHLDWAYIDTSHEFEHTKSELDLLARKIKDGGLITGHDWQEDAGHRHHGLYVAVNRFCSTQGWGVILLDNHGQWAIRRRRAASGFRGATGGGGRGEDQRLHSDV